MDSRLPQMVRDLHRFLFDAQRLVSQECFRLRDEGIDDLAGILVDFAADVHGGTGIWGSYERYNADLFGTPLPLTAEDDFPESLGGIHQERIRHLLWVVYQRLSNAAVHSPRDEDIHRLAEATCCFLNDKFANTSWSNARESKTSATQMTSFASDVPHGRVLAQSISWQAFLTSVTMTEKTCEVGMKGMLLHT